MSDFDKVARRACKLRPAAFFAWLLTRFAEHLRFVRWLDTRRIPFWAQPSST